MPSDVPPAGSPEAIEAGCTCPQLANAAYRVGQDLEPLLAPDCLVHTPAGSDEQRPPDPDH